MEEAISYAGQERILLLQFQSLMYEGHHSV